MAYHSHVNSLAAWIREDGQRESDFQTAITTALSYGLSEFDGWSGLDDYLTFISWILTWVPCETFDGRSIFTQFSKVYFILNQPSILPYQSTIRPRKVSEPLSWLSCWISEYGRIFGAYMDTPASLTPATLATFHDSPKFRAGDYEEPAEGWRTFNEFFARAVKPNARPIDRPGDNAVVVSPADCTYIEMMPINLDTMIVAKTVPWDVAELLNWSSFAAKFAGGSIVHGFLSTFDYHRVHSPLGGCVLQAQVVSGAHYAQIEVVDKADGDDNDGASLVESIDKPLNARRSALVAKNSYSSDQTSINAKQLRKRRVLNAPNDWGYQFSQARGLVILATPVGYVAVVAVGMAVVCSVVLSVSVGDEIQKGDEIGYFQFGGSDLIILFEKDLKNFAKLGSHCLMGEEIASLNMNIDER